MVSGSDWTAHHLGPVRDPLVAAAKNGMGGTCTCTALSRIMGQSVCGRDGSAKAFGRGLTRAPYTRRGIVASNTTGAAGAARNGTNGQRDLLDAAADPAGEPGTSDNMDAEQADQTDAPGEIDGGGVLQGNRKPAGRSDAAAEDTGGTVAGDSKAGPKSDAKADAKNDRRKGTIPYPPYVNAYGAVPKLFAAIQNASVPPKFSQDYLVSVLELKSTSHRALIPLLKRLGFLDAANVPTAKYRAVRDEERGARVLAEQIREAYSSLYSANEYAHTLGRAELTSKLRSVLGTAADDPVIPSVVGTFMELVKLADFDADDPGDDADDPPSRSRGRRRPADDEMDDDADDETKPTRRAQPRADGTGGVALGMSYTINLNLPATTDVQVFNAIFKALREHILGGR